MSKVKPPKSKGIPNKHLHARSSFLYQAATYLTLQTSSCHEVATDVPQSEQTQSHDASKSQKQSPLALELGSDLQQVSRKGQLRLAVDLKRSLCKSCNTVLVPGRTATQTVENHSKGGKKPWANLLIVTCGVCGGKKRFPVGAKPQLKKSKRKVAPAVAASTTASEEGLLSDTILLTGTE